MRSLAVIVIVIVIVVAALGVTSLGGGRPSASATVAGSAIAARGADASGDALVHADAARALGYTGKGVTVAILDTGIDDRDPGLTGTVVAEHCIVPPDGCPGGTPEADGPGSAQDDQGHGTTIADIVAGRGVAGPVGVAPDASLVVVKVADHNGRTSTAQIQAGLDWVRANHSEVRVVNVSLAGDIPLSGDCTGLTAALQSYAASVNALRAQGATVFAAAGNNGAHNGLPAPACFPATVAVGAVYSRAFGSYTAPSICRDTVTAPDQVACFSNASSELDLLAVGAPVDAIGLGGADAPTAGTSAASAQAAGAAADLLQADPQLSPDALVALLEQTGVSIVDPRRQVATPRLDVAAALAVVLGRPVPLLPAPTVPGPVVAPPLAKPTVPNAAVSTMSISFGAVRSGRVVTRKLVVSNTGTGFLAVRVASGLGAVTATPGRLTIGAGQRRSVILTFRPTRSGRFRGSVRLGTDDPVHPTLVVAVVGTGRA